jgi:hypothetical protein
MPYMELLPPRDDIESHRVSLSLDQVQARIETDRHVKELDYVPKKVAVIGNQIFQILPFPKRRSGIEASPSAAARKSACNGPAIRQRHGELQPYWGGAHGGRVRPLR